MKLLLALDVVFWRPVGTYNISVEGQTFTFNEQTIQPFSNRANQGHDYRKMKSTHVFQLANSKT